MNDSGTNPNPINSDLADQVEALRRQVFILLLALIVISSALATYLLYQARVAGKSVDGIKPQATQVIQAYSQAVPHLNQISNFVNQITAYAIAHPEFRPVLQKYGWNPPPAAAPKR